MIPDKYTDTLQIPVTFDSRNSYRSAEAGRSLWLFLIIILWVVSSVIVVIISETWKGWLFPPISFFILSYIVRFLVFREHHYKKLRRELRANNYLFNHSLFWNIYEISSRYPYISTFGNGMKGIFIAFDKDVVVGKEEDNSYYHHEAISEAYKQMQKRGIEAFHLDYMDTVGKDTRMEALFRQAEKTKNEDLRKVLLRSYDYLEYKMNKSYSTYDVYCFYTYQREELFWDELQIIVKYMLEANFIRARVLNRNEISALVETFINVEEFSVQRANDMIFREMNNNQQYIRPLWVEKDGVRTELNKSLEEIAEVKRIKTVEKKVKRKRSINDLPFKRNNSEPEIKLFSDEDSEETIEVESENERTYAQDSQPSYDKGKVEKDSEKDDEQEIKLFD